MYGLLCPSHHFPKAEAMNPILQMMQVDQELLSHAKFPAQAGISPEVAGVWDVRNGTNTFGLEQCVGATKRDKGRFLSSPKNRLKELMFLFVFFFFLIS